MGWPADGNIRPGAAGTEKATREAEDGTGMGDRAPRRSGEAEPSLFSNGSK